MSSRLNVDSMACRCLVSVEIIPDGWSSMKRVALSSASSILFRSSWLRSAAVTIGSISVSSFSYSSSEALSLSSTPAPALASIDLSEDEMVSSSNKPLDRSRALR